MFTKTRKRGRRKAETRFPEITDLLLGVAMVLLGGAIILGILQWDFSPRAFGSSLLTFCLLTLVPVYAVFSLWYGFAGLVVVGAAFWASQRLRRRWQRVAGAMVSQLLLTGYGFICIGALEIAA